MSITKLSSDSAGTNVQEFLNAKLANIIRMENELLTNKGCCIDSIIMLSKSRLALEKIEALIDTLGHKKKDYNEILEIYKKEKKEKNI